MRDLFFYPLCALIIAAMIAYALSFSQEAEPFDAAKGFEASGEDLQYFLVPSQLEFTLKTDTQIGQTVAVLTSRANIKTAPPSSGITMRMGPEIEAAFEGGTLEMIIRARAGETSPTPAFQMGYFALGAKTSGWKRFTPTDKYKDYKVQFTRGKTSGTARGDYAGIWPDLEGNGRTLNVASVIVRRVDDQ